MGNVLKSLLSPEPNSASTMRFVTLFGVIVVFAVWAIMCIKGNALFDLPTNIDYALLILIGGKAGQKIFGEQQGNPVPNVVGQTQAAATAAITTAGFTLGSVTTQPGTTVPSGSVISQTPGAGVSGASDGLISLVVSA